MNNLKSMKTAHKKMTVKFLVASSMIFGALFGNYAQAAVVVPGFEVATVAGGFSLPTAMAFAQDGRIFVAEKGGKVRVVKNGALLPDPVITLTDLNSFGDRGLIGIATDPNFTSNGYLYLSYTYENSPGSNFGGQKTGRIVRVTVVGDTASESSKVVLVGTVGGTAATPSCENFAAGTDCIPSDSPSHTVGGLRFGPDGKLYATTGDGADFSAVDPRALRAQNLDSLGGKTLRINTDGTAPADNPFFNGNANANRSKVYALGVRNMFRLNFHPVTGQLFGGDVGWSTWEEVNKITSGGNYGWPCIEGNFASSYNCTPSSAATLPTYVYGHDASGAGSITVGTFPANGAYPAQYNNTMFIGDYAQNWIKLLTLDAAGNNVVSVVDLIPDTVWPVDLSTGPDGNVYYIDIAFSSLNRITHTTGNRRPVVAVSANPTSGLTPLSVNFSSAGSNDPDNDPLTYAWNFGDGATANIANPTHVYNANGAYAATLTLSDDKGSSASKSVTITVGNQAPSANITSPANGSLYTAGQTIQLNGVGTDPEDGALPASAYSWQILLHHNTHVHFMQQINGVINSSIIGDNHNDPSVYTEVILTVRDSGGLTSNKSINLYFDNGSGVGNLIQNPSAETPDSVPGQPLSWFQGWFGNMNPIFTYPVPGFDGASAMKLQVTSYTDGDAKWFFSPVAVTPGQQYRFSDVYTANVATELMAQFGMPGGTYQYLQLAAALPPVATPTAVERTFVVPAGVQTMTVFHQLGGIGILTTDNFSLSLATPPPDTIAPVVSIVFPGDASTIDDGRSISVDATDNVAVVGVTLLVDGVQAGAEDTTGTYPESWGWGWNNNWGKIYTNGPHTVAVRARDAAGNTTTSPTITLVLNNANLVLNRSLEIDENADGMPDTWQKGGWGTNTFAFTYPTVGIDGAKAAKVEITAYTDGDRKWYFQDVAVTPGSVYAFSNRYKSNVSTQLVARHTLTGGAVQYQFLGTVPAGSGTWPTVNFNITAPANAVSMTVFHVLHSVGWLEVDDYSFTKVGADTMPPFGNVTAPAENSTVSGNVIVTATANDFVGVVGVTLLIDGAAVETEDTTAPYEFTWNSASVTNGAHTISARARDAAGNQTTYFGHPVIVDNSAPTDTTAPTVSVTAPVNAATVSGTVNITTTAADNIGVAGVTLLIDGVVNGVEDTTAPYDFSWNSTTVANGAHTISARARDAAGNTTTSTVVNVTVNNVVSSNLIQNPSLETDANADAIPDNWNKGGWGTNTFAFTYPTVGIDGAKAAKVEITAYTNGDRKWYFQDVPVTAGQVYTFTNQYKSTAVTQLLARHTLAGGAVQYQFLANVPAAVSWTPTSFNITAPANAVSMTVFHILFSVGSLEVDNYSLTTQAPADTTAPTVSVTAPANAATVSGTVNVTTTAADNIGVAGVTLLIDGVANGAEDTTAPYDFSWNSTTVANGAHTISARARDAAGNTTTSTVVNVTVSNVAAPTNLIQNPSLETDANVDNIPDLWSKGGWGTNTFTFTYPSAGSNGVTGAKIDITAYTDGDRKWYFQDVPVTAGQTYTISHDYKSSASTEVLARYTLTGGALQYQFLGAVPAQVNWTPNTYNVTISANAVSMTLFHVIHSVGSLEVDNFSLTNQSAPDATLPTVSVTAPANNATVSGTVNVTTTAADNVGVAGVTLLIDGVVNGAEDTTAPYDFSWNSTTVANGAHTISARARDTAGNTTTSTVVNVTVNNVASSNLILNGDLETVDGTNPLNWTPNTWGDHTTVHTYPVIGFNGLKAARTEITAYPANGTGDAKWAFQKVAVSSTRQYSYTDHYRSNTISDIIGQYTLSDGTFHYFGLVKEIQPTATWQTATGTFTPAANATHVTFLHLISSIGFVEIDDASLVDIGPAGAPSETNPPVVNFTNPLAGQTVAGTVTITVNSTDDTAVTYIYYAIDGVPVTGQLTTAPYAFAWNTTTVPNGPHTLKATTHDPFGNNSTDTIVVTVDQSALDTTAPTVSVTAPADGNIVSGTMNVTTIATDNVSVAGVTLLIDGVVMDTETEDTVAPYDFTWNSAAVVNGPHTLSARARDAAGNITISAAVNVTVNNAPAIPNLIQNFSLEADANVDSIPDTWVKGGWGTNNRFYTYPVAGIEGARAARITITSYTDGDAKWYFANVPVTPGNIYTFTDKYRSGVQTNVTIRYTMTNGTVQYVGLANPAVSPTNWATFSNTFTIPPGVASMTVMHILDKVGMLDVDDYVLYAGASSQFAKGMVSYTFDDGLISHYTAALPILNAANVDGVFYVVSTRSANTSDVELIANPSLETDADANNIPDQWRTGGSGTNDRTFTYPVAGSSGSGVRVQVTSYTDGDAMWFFDDAVVAPITNYIITLDYNSTVNSTLKARFTKIDGSVADVLIQSLPSTGGVWQHFAGEVATPSGTVSMTFFDSLAGVGSLTTDAYSLKQEHRELDTAQILEMQAAGHEIGAHTKTHAHLTQLTPAEAEDQIAGSKAELLSMGVTSVDTFAYPFGEYNADIQAMVQSAGYTAGRSVDNGYNTKTTDKFALKIQQVDRQSTLAEVENWINEAALNKIWLILMFHQINDDMTATLGVTPEFLQQIVSYTPTTNIDVVTVRQGVAQMNP